MNNAAVAGLDEVKVKYIVTIIVIHSSNKMSH